MYGGNHYIQSADITAQGRAIAEAAKRFGDGKTLLFAPFKRYYNPYMEDEDGKRRLYVCRLHHKTRKLRAE